MLWITCILVNKSNDLWFRWLTSLEHLVFYKEVINYSLHHSKMSQYICDSLCAFGVTWGLYLFRNHKKES